MHSRDKKIKTEKIINYLVNSLDNFKKNIPPKNELGYEVAADILDTSLLVDTIDDINSHKARFQAGLTPEEIINSIEQFQAQLKNLKFQNSKTQILYEKALPGLLKGLEPAKSQLINALEIKKANKIEKSKLTNPEAGKPNLFQPQANLNAEQQMRLRDSLIVIHEGYEKLIPNIDKRISQLLKVKESSNDEIANLENLKNILVTFTHVIREEIRGKDKTNIVKLLTVFNQYISSVSKVELDNDDFYKKSALNIIQEGMQKIMKFESELQSEHKNRP